jgi:hypothetical protein
MFEVENKKNQNKQNNNTSSRLWLLLMTSATGLLPLGAGLFASPHVLQVLHLLLLLHT